jgi:cell division protein FtsL
MSAVEQLTEIFDAKLRAPVRWLIALIVFVAMGTAAVVTMAYDVRQIAVDARREADAAKQLAADLRSTVIGHERDIAVLRSQVGARMKE